MKRPFMIVCILLIIMCVLRLYIFDDAPPPEVIPKETVTFQGRIDYWETDADRTILYLSNVFFYGDSAEEISTYKLNGIRCYLKSRDGYKLGQSVVVQGFLALPEAASNQGEFDGATYYKTQGYEYVLYDAAVLASGQEYDLVLEALNRFRIYATQRLYRFLEPESAGIMTAMLLGDKQGIAEETKTLYRTVGIYHILAISGLHIAMIGGLLYKILKFLRVKPFFAALISITIIVFYGLMIRMPPSAFRAVIMFGFGLMAPLLKRSHDKFTSLTFAAACLLVWNPLLIKDAGMQLSFLAVLGIIWLYPTFLGLHRHHMKIGDGLWVSFAVTYMTLPVIMDTYYEVPIYAMLSNVCVVPFVPVLISLGIVIVLGGGLPDLFLEFAATVIQWILYFYEKILTVFSALPWNSYVTGAPELWKKVVFYGVLVLLLFYVTNVKRKLLIRSLKSEQAYYEGKQAEYTCEQKIICGKMRSLRVLQFVVMVLLLLFLLLPGKTDCRITFLDVGQGDGICIESGDEVYLIDCGSTSQNYIGRYTLLPFLKYHGIIEIDGWFLTHPDADHISAWQELCKEEDMGGIRVKTLYIPKVLEKEFKEVIAMATEKGISVEMLNAGNAVNTDNVKWTVLSPDESMTYYDNNSASLVLFFSHKDITGVFMADAGTEAEKAVTDAQINQVSFLKVAHHGSGADTNTQLFYERIAPQLAVISCGKDNSYGHPHAEVLERLENCNIPVYRTDRNHQITIENRNHKIMVKVLHF